MSKIYASVLVLLFLSPLLIEAHEANIKGTIKNNYTKVALPNINILLKGTEYKTTSDSVGNYQFINIPARNYTMIFEQQGYFKSEQEVDLKEDATLKLDAYLYPEMIDLPSVETSTLKANSGASSGIVSAIDLELRPRASAQDMLRIVPGLFIAEHQGGGKAEQIFLRGFDCDHGTDIATFVDGVPVNMPSHGHGQGYADLHFLIPEVVKSMDVYKGPYQAQYGDFATAGVVAFNSYDTLAHNTIRLEAGSTPTQRGFSSSRILAMVNIPTGLSRISSFAAAEYNYTPGYFDRNAEYNRFNIFGKVKAKLSNTADLSLSVASFAGSWNGTGQIPERAVNAGLITRFGVLDPCEGGSTQRTNVNLQFRNITEHSQFNANLFYVAYRFKLFTNFTFFLNDTLRGDGIEQTDSRSVVGFNTSYARFYELGKYKAKTTIGAGFRTDLIDNSLWHDQARVRLENVALANVHENSANLYIKQDITFSKYFRADLAVRGDYFTFNVDDQHRGDSSYQNISGYNYQVLPSYKLNLVFSPTPYLQLFVNNGIGYHSNDARATVRDQAKHILPMAFASELGASVRIGNRAILSTAFWMLDLSNELVYGGDDGTTSDKGASRRMGIDVSGRVQLTKWLTADADVNYSYNYLTNKFLGSRQATDYLIPLAPTLTSQGGLSARHKSGVRGRIGYRTIADRPAIEDNTVKAQGYFVMDALVAFARKHYQLSLSVENLLNTKWNEAQFETFTRLRNEAHGVSELHFTAGTPFAIKFGVSYYF